jgi:SAM-dependent methyltransferase
MSSSVAMNPSEAVMQVTARFPFPGYVEEGRGGCLDVAGTVLKHLAPGSQILDFGSGPCDKTAVLQLLGYKCTGYDDLSDVWHVRDGNREKIMQFAKEIGIDFHLAEGREIPFAPNSFDMVMLHHVLEHLHDSPRELMNAVVNLIKPGGLLYVTVPNAGNLRKRLALLRGKTNYPAYETFYWYPGSWRGHVREYVKGDLAALAKFLQLEIVELRSCDHMLKVLSPAKKTVFQLISKLMPGVKDTWGLVARKPAHWKPTAELSPEELSRVKGIKLPTAN